MILDGNLQFTGGTTAPGNSDVATDSPTTGTQVSSNALDLHMAGIPTLANGQGARDIGIGDDPSLKLNIQVTTAFTVGTSLQVNLQGATDNGSGAPAGFVTMLSGAVVALANLGIGQQLLPVDMPRPPAGVAIPRFLQLQYVTVGTFSLGKLRGFVMGDRIDQYFTATNNNVLSGYPAGLVVNN
jgi:hypothetical protein